MKKIVIAVVLSLLLINFSFGQAFEKGNWNIDVDLGAAAYGVQTTNTIVIGALTFTQTDGDGTASTVFRLGGEYGISDRIGLGLKLGTSNYFIAEEDKDTVKSVRSTDFALNFNFHMLNAQKNDLFLTLGFGVANGKWEYQNSPGIFLSYISGSGSYFTLGLTDRIFFSDHIGMLFKLSYEGLTFKGVPELSQDGKTLVGNLNYSWNVDFKLSGVYFGTGLAIKF